MWETRDVGDVYATQMRGIILAGGTGSRLWPLTKSVNKHFLPIFDKPMIYYPLSTLMLAGIKEILIISSAEHIDTFKNHFLDGSSLGIELSYKIQEKPGGLPQGISVGKEFIGEENFALILGDNVFHGVGLGKSLQMEEHFEGSKIFCYQVSNPSQFGVAEIINNHIISIEEKPDNPKTNLAITGLYFFDNNAKNFVEDLKPSARGELEIVDLLRKYLHINKLDFEILPRGTAWLDTGSPSSLLEASEYIQIVEKRQGMKISSIEEISWRNGWISNSELILLAEKTVNSEYRDYLLKLI